MAPHARDTNPGWPETVSLVSQRDPFRARAPTALLSGLVEYRWVLTLTTHGRPAAMLNSAWPGQSNDSSSVSDYE
jgi:hypothetical protein